MKKEYKINHLGLTLKVECDSANGNLLYEHINLIISQDLVKFVPMENIAVIAEPVVYQDKA